jgi:hypothetical protein
MPFLGRLPLSPLAPSLVPLLAATVFLGLSVLLARWAYVALWDKTAMHLLLLSALMVLASTGNIAQPTHLRHFVTTSKLVNIEVTHLAYVPFHKFVRYQYDGLMWYVWIYSYIRGI